MNEEAVFVIAWYGFAWLLNRPFGSRVRRRVAMEDTAGTDLHHHENVNDAEADSDRDQEVACEQGPGMIADKVAPILRIPM